MAMPYWKQLQDERAAARTAMLQRSQIIEQVENKLEKTDLSDDALFSAIAEELMEKGFALIDSEHARYLEIATREPTAEESIK